MALKKLEYAVYIILVELNLIIESTLEKLLKINLIVFWMYLFKIYLHKNNNTIPIDSVLLLVVIGYLASFAFNLECSIIE